MCPANPTAGPRRARVAAVLRLIPSPLRQFGKPSYIRRYIDTNNDKGLAAFNLLTPV